METDIEEKIRSRIEAVLLNDARNCDDLRTMTSPEDPVEADPFAEDRNVYQRIINSYRNAVGEVSGLLEETVGLQTGLSRIVESIKDQSDFQRICSQVVECVLRDLEAEYCGLVVRTSEESKEESCYVEGIREQRKFLCSHSHATLLGSPEFDSLIKEIAAEGADCVTIGDVYREPRFTTVDFPSVVRSLVILPIRVRQTSIGALLLSHSLPHVFKENHTRVLKTLASMIAHLRLLTERHGSNEVEKAAGRPRGDEAENDETLSIVLLNFESSDSARRLLADRGTLRNIRGPLSRTLGGKESILLYDDTELLVLLPGTMADALPPRLGQLREAFDAWKAEQGEKARSIRLNLGYSTCESGEDMTRTLEAASLMMRTNQGE